MKKQSVTIRPIRKIVEYRPGNQCNALFLIPYDTTVAESVIDIEAANIELAYQFGDINAIQYCQMMRALRERREAA